MSDYYSSDAWGQALGPSKKKKKKDQARLNTSYWLPRLDEMVLLHPISTRSDGVSKEEKTRVVMVNEQLEKYNRWLPFIQSSKPGRNVRNAGTDLQVAVHDLNALVAGMMIKIDQRIADVQEAAEDFVEAVRQDGGWQTNGDLLDLTYDELDEILTKHPHRHTDPYRQHLCFTVWNSRPVTILLTRPRRDPFGLDWAIAVPEPPPPDRHLDKLLRLVSEVSQCEDGLCEAFHLLILLKTRAVTKYEGESLRPDAVLDHDGERIDQEVLKLVQEADLAAAQNRLPNGRIFFNFAAAARDMFVHLPLGCGICHRPPPPPPPPPPGIIDPFAGLFPDPPCVRPPYLQLLQTVQQWAQGEILSGIMLAFSRKLPRELCFLVFEYAMEAEELPLNPRVWEDDDYIMGMRIAGALRKRYVCPKPKPPRNPCTNVVADATQTIENVAATPRTTVARPSHQKCHLLNLPAELRLRIYEFYFRDIRLPLLPIVVDDETCEAYASLVEEYREVAAEDKSQLAQKMRGNTHGFCLENDPLLATCRLMRREASEVMTKDSSMAIRLAFPCCYWEPNKLIAKDIGELDWIYPRDSLTSIIDVDNRVGDPVQWTRYLEAIEWCAHFKPLIAVLYLFPDDKLQHLGLAGFDGAIDVLKKIKTEASIEMAMTVIREDIKAEAMADRLKAIDSEQKFTDLVKHLGA
ncbi:uncharacterized protein LTR77_000324 [Saxophila tyrrhenica]|uniref:Uncharacterized protein n=1 Tax=Saxophila tyrrhenica TaxID=1690608 RepID=A0AAV9PMX4_9PEZI|nr:hypothetical protein LTR77_000324 [Saxophila tyrrhenica]